MDNDQRSGAAETRLAAHRCGTRGVRCAAPLLIAGVVAICSTAAGAGTPGSLGQVIAQLEVVGGFGPVAARGVPGRVFFTRSSGDVSSLKSSLTLMFRTGDHGSFDVVVPAGVYRVTGSSPKVTDNGIPARCAAANPIRVAARSTSPRSTAIADRGACSLRGEIRERAG